MLAHLYERGNARRHPCKSAPCADGKRGDRGHRPALLPVGRDEDRALPGQGAASALSRAGGPAYKRNVCTGYVHKPADRCAGGVSHDDSRPRACTHHAPRLRDRVRLSRPAAAGGNACGQGHRWTLLRRTVKRDERLRGGGGAGPDRGHQCRTQHCRGGAADPAAQ